MTQTGIAKKIGNNRSVISRETKRNSDLRNSNYSAFLANKKTQRRHKSKVKTKKEVLGYNGSAKKAIKK